MYIISFTRHTELKEKTFLPLLKNERLMHIQLIETGFFYADGGAMDLSDMIDLSGIRLTMPDMGTVNLGDIMDNLDISISSETFGDIATGLLAGYQEYAKEHPEADYSGLGDAFAAFLRTPEGQEILSENIRELIQSGGGVQITTDQIRQLFRDILTGYAEYVQNMGYEVILVSSGAIAVGRNKLNMHTKPDSMRMKQAAAAVGQCSLMYLYDKFFGDYDKTVAQILLNAEDIEQEEKKENLTNTFNALLEMGVIPIVNENDSVSYTEIESEDRLFGDNDMLSSVVAVLCRAKRLVILSDIDGFYDSDPRLHPNAQLIEQIDTIDESVYSLAGGAGSRRGTGGMRTKLQAAQLATSNGIDTIVTNGKRPEALYDIVKGGKAGTLFTGKL